MKIITHPRHITPIAALILLCSCGNASETSKRTGASTVVDTTTITDAGMMIENIIEMHADTTTTFILVRHAEIPGGGGNPDLNVSGHARAAELRRVLENVALDAVFSTNLNRTLQTATPVALSKGLAVQTYDPFAPDVLIDEVLASYRNGIVLIVGHSNTTPVFVNTLIGEQVYSDIPETEFDNLYVVSVSQKGRAKVEHMKYGD